MIFFIRKARRAPVGSIRRRKGGLFKKTRPGHWQILHEIVNQKLESADVHPNTGEGRLMRIAATQLTRHMTTKTGPYNRTIADKFLTQQFGHLRYRRFGEWKRLTIDSVEKYINHIAALDTGERASNPTKTFIAVKKWREKLKEETFLLNSDSERDAWVAAQFKRSGKPISAVLFAARQVLGSLHMSMIDESSFAGFCKAIITKCYEKGPAEVQTDEVRRWAKAFRTLNRKKRLVNIQAALMTHIHEDPLWEREAKWFKYCAGRMNARSGKVDLNAMTNYIKNAKRKYKVPPRIDHDMHDETVRAKIRLGLIGLQKKKGKLVKADAATGYRGDVLPEEVTLESWMSYLNEGGPVIPPARISDKTLEEIVAQFDLLSIHEDESE